MKVRNRMESSFIVRFLIYLVYSWKIFWEKLIRFRVIDGFIV